MDKFIASFPAEDDGDLMLCPAQGVAYQKDRSHLVSYDAAYYDKCASYADKEIARKINAGRIALVQKHFGDGLVVDIGIGSGEFIRNRPNTFGFDVNPVGIEWLRRNNLFAHYLSDFDAFTLWDVIEHVETPETYFRHMGEGAMVFVSIPVFADLKRIRESKHYRPGEHLQYWTAEGFLFWMGLHGFTCLDHQTFEIEAGREDIHSFAFHRAG